MLAFVVASQSTNFFIFKILSNVNRHYDIKTILRELFNMGSQQSLKLKMLIKSVYLKLQEV